jgi:hypothetical protein
MEMQLMSCFQCPPTDGMFLMSVVIISYVVMVIMLIKENVHKVEKRKKRESNLYEDQRNGNFDRSMRERIFSRARKRRNNVIERDL